MKLNLVFCVMAVLSLTASARPALQPFPRECVWENGAIDASALPVVRDDVRQCAIGADEVLSTGARSVYAGEELKDAVYLAVEGSPLAQKLVTAICALSSLKTVVEGNVIRDFRTVGLELRQSDLTEVVGNIFEDGPVAAQFSLSRDCRMIGNLYSDCKPYRMTCEGKSKTLIKPRVINE